MGNYGEIPHRPPISFNSNLHQAETKNLQRIKSTPFVNSQVYCLNPPIFIEPLQMKLSQLLHPRLMTKQLFPLSEVFKIINNILTALLQLQAQGFQAHGDITAETIYYDTKVKEFKLVHPLLVEESGFELMREGKRLSYLSPEQLLILSEGQSMKKNEVSIKSDIFCLGVLLCQVCSLLPSSEIYCSQTYSIFDLQIQNRFNIMREYYKEMQSEQGQKVQEMIECIQEMLQYDEMMRKDSRELLKRYGDGNGQLIKWEHRVQEKMGLKVRNRKNDEKGWVK